MKKSRAQSASKSASKKTTLRPLATVDARRDHTKSWETARVAETVRVPYGSPRDRVVPAGQFKAQCLELMDQVRDRNEPIIITKRGIPVARLVPVTSKAQGLVGFMRGTVLSYGDIISPIDVEWDALND